MLRDTRPGTKGRRLETGTTDKQCSPSRSLTGLCLTIFLMQPRMTYSPTQDRTIWRAGCHPTNHLLRPSITNMPVDQPYKDYYSVHTMFIQKILGCAKFIVNDTKDGQKAKMENSYAFPTAGFLYFYFVCNWGCCGISTLHLKVMY